MKSPTYAEQCAATCREPAGITPGQWTVSIRRDGLGQAPGGHSFEIVHNYPDGGQQVIVGKHTGIDCLTEANARFIASAPKLLAQCQRFLGLLDRSGDGEITQTPEAIAELRAVIEKATP